MPLCRQNFGCSRFHRSCTRLVRFRDALALDEHVARVDRLPEVDDGAVAFVVSFSDLLLPPCYHGV